MEPANAHSIPLYHNRVTVTSEVNFTSLNRTMVQLMYPNVKKGNSLQRSDHSKTKQYLQTRIEIKISLQREENCGKWLTWVGGQTIHNLESGTNILTKAKSVQQSLNHLVIWVIGYPAKTNVRSRDLKKEYYFGELWDLK